MNRIEIEKRIRRMKPGEIIELSSVAERDRAYAAARFLKTLELIDFEITCPSTERGFVAMRKPK